MNIEWMSAHCFLSLTHAQGTTDKTHPCKIIFLCISYLEVKLPMGYDNYYRQ